ncbi:MAG: spermidine synthase [Chromatiaceae bacterium]|nr:spermidine synthase [Chromatiaceae bacterium]
MPGKDKWPAIVMALVIWGFAGGLFGALFAALQALLAVLGFSASTPFWMAVVVAAMTTSAFYSAMPVALVGSMAGILAAIAALILGGAQLSLLAMTVLTCAAGVVAGGFQAWVSRAGARPLAEALTGVLAGLLAAALLLLMPGLDPRTLGTFLLSALVVALVGALFQLAERWLVARALSGLPALLSAPLVAGAIAAVVGASVWMLVGSSDPALDVASRTAIERIFDEVPLGFLGGMLGGVLTGLALELLGFRLEDQPHDAGL